MKILISADMEGASGVAQWDNVTPGNADYLARFRHFITADVNAAIAGAIEAGASEVLVADGHWHGYNILIEELDGHARLSTGFSSPFAMLQGIESRPDGVVLIGYHAMEGSPAAVLNHTWSNTRISALHINGKVYGEIGLNAALAGEFGAPILAVSGDQAACAEAREYIGKQVETAQVKIATGQFSAELLPLEQARELIGKTVAQGVINLAKNKAPSPMLLSKPVVIKIDFTHSAYAERASWMPGAELSAPRQVTYEAPNTSTAFRAFRTMVAAARD